MEAHTTSFFHKRMFLSERARIAENRDREWIFLRGRKKNEDLCANFDREDDLRRRPTLLICPVWAMRCGPFTF